MGDDDQLKAEREGNLLIFINNIGQGYSARKGGSCNCIENEEGIYISTDNLDNSLARSLSVCLSFMIR